MEEEKKRESCTRMIPKHGSYLLILGTAKEICGLDSELKCKQATQRSYMYLVHMARPLLQSWWSVSMPADCESARRHVDAPKHARLKRHSGRGRRGVSEAICRLHLRSQDPRSYQNRVRHSWSWRRSMFGDDVGRKANDRGAPPTIGTPIYVGVWIIVPALIGLYALPFICMMSGCNLSPPCLSVSLCVRFRLLVHRRGRSIEGSCTVCTDHMNQKQRSLTSLRRVQR